MLKTIVRKEIAHQINSAKFAVMLLLVVILAILSSLVMIQDYQLRVENYEILKPSAEDTVAMKVPEPMSMLVKGLDERMGRSINIGVLGGMDVGSSQSAANRLFALFRQLDMHFVALVIMSLAAILFSFDMISGEKRNGTLKLKLVNSVSRNKVLLGKWLAAMLVVSIPVIVAFIISLLSIQFMVPGEIGLDFYARTALFVLSILLYLAVFISLGLMISSLTQRPSISLILALLVWGLLVFVIPNAVALTANNLVPGDTANELETRASSVWFREMFRLNRGDFEGAPYSEVTKITANQYANIYQEYLNLSGQRIDLLGRLSFMSPVGPFNFLSWGFAGTGPLDSLHFKEAVLNYHPMAVEDAMKLMSIRRNFEDADPDFKAQLFEYHPRQIPDTFADEVPTSAGILILMSILLYAFAYFAFVKYDVR